MFINKNLRNLLLTLTITLPLVSLATRSALAGSGFNVINQSGNEIFYLYITESDTSNWEQDLLKKDILKDRQERTFYLPRYHSCDYVIKAVFYNRNEITEHINLCENTNVIIKSQEIQTN